MEEVIDDVQSKVEKKREKKREWFNNNREHMREVIRTYQYAKYHTNDEYRESIKQSSAKYYKNKIENDDEFQFMHRERSRVSAYEKYHNDKKKGQVRVLGNYYLKKIFKKRDDYTTTEEMVANEMLMCKCELTCMYVIDNIEEYIRKRT